MRIAIGQLWQETNTFNPLPTTRADFEAFGVVRGAELVERMADMNELGGFIQSLRKWPEKSERETRWFAPEKASGLVAPVGLADILRSATRQLLVGSA